MLQFLLNTFLEGTFLIYKLILFLFIFSFSLFANNNKQNNNELLNLQLTLISSFSETVHSLQQERGASCGYISSQGKKFTEKIKNIRDSSDKKISTLHKLLQKKNISLFFNQEQQNRLNKTLRYIILTRKKVSNLQINFPLTYSQYTKSITLILSDIATIIEKIEDTQLNNTLYTYSILLLHKESIGQKRAALSALFSLQKPAKEIFEYYLISDIQEKMYLKSFLRNASFATKTKYNEILKNPAFKQVKLYEKLAQDKLSDKKVTVDPQKWFHDVTIKIDLIQEIEYSLFQESLERIVKLKNIHKIDLTDEENRWIESHIVKVGVEQWSPIIFSNDTQDIDGIAGDYIKLIIEKTGLQIDVVNKRWEILLQEFKDKKIDLLPATYKTDNRAKFGLYSKESYFKIKDAIYFKNSNTDIHSLKDLEGDTLAIPIGYGMIDKIHTKFPKIKIVITKSLDDSINRVLNGEITAFYEGQIAANKKITTELIQGLKFVYVTGFETPGLYFYSQKDIPILHNIIEKAMQTITPTEKKEILKKWSPPQIEIDYKYVWQIATVLIFVIILFLFISRKMKLKIKEKTADIEKKNYELEKLVTSFNRNVIFSHTDLKGNITQVSEAFCKISGYTEEELLGQPHSILRHPDMPKSTFQNVWKDLQKQACIKAEIKNLKKDGSFYWVISKFEPEYNLNGEHIGYSALREDITDKKAIEELTKNLEQEVKSQTQKFKEQTEFVQTLLDSQEQLIITTDGVSLKSVNETFLDFFAIDSIDEFQEEYGTSCICETFNNNTPENYLKPHMEHQVWIDHILLQPFGTTNKVMITLHDRDFIFSVSAAKLPGEGGLKSAVFTNITEIEHAKQEVEIIHKNIKDSIEYASLIQGALIPENKTFQDYFQDYFTIWHPKDTVGGDIYLFEKLRSEDECLLMVIDCTGHGVPGAFVTMLVKAIERQIVAKIKHSDEVVSPANLLSVFNRSMKHLLKQEDKESVSNAGFDGSIIYYNKKDKILKFAGAETPLFYIKDNELKMIKGSRYSVGYKKCKVDYQYQEHIINVEKGMQFYLTTDGYLDQNGGEKGFPFSKKRFKNIINKYHKETMADQQEVLLNELDQYQDEYETNDDITVIGIKI